MFEQKMQREASQSYCQKRKTWPLFRKAAWHRCLFFLILSSGRWEFLSLVLSHFLQIWDLCMASMVLCRSWVAVNNSSLLLRSRLGKNCGGNLNVATLDVFSLKKEKRLLRLVLYNPFQKEKNVPLPCIFSNLKQKDLKDFLLLYLHAKAESTSN